jgi:hypothetical protein
MTSTDAPATVAFVVAKGKTTVKSWAVEVGDSVRELAEVPADADVVFTFSPEDAAAYRSGELDLSVGFMRGQVKMAGDFGALLRVLPRLAAL